MVGPADMSAMAVFRRQMLVYRLDSGKVSELVAVVVRFVDTPDEFVEVSLFVGANVESIEAGSCSVCDWLV